MTEDQQTLAQLISRADQSRANLGEWLHELRARPVACQKLQQYINHGIQQPDDLRLSLVCRMARMLWREIVAEQLREEVDNDEGED